jgi:hypothetical protein
MICTLHTCRGESVSMSQLHAAKACTSWSGLSTQWDTGEAVVCGGVTGGTEIM